MVSLEITDNIKMLRETLCAAQHAVNSTLYDQSKAPSRSAMLQRLINECDRHRPLGINGKHGNMHTDTCGCEDKGARETWGTTTPVVQEEVVHGWKINGGYMWCGETIGKATEFDIRAITCTACQTAIKEDWDGPRG